jgi:hypothetical protein
MSLQRRGKSPVSNDVGFLCAKWALHQRVRGGAEMVINQMIDGLTYVRGTEKVSGAIIGTHPYA